MLEKDGKMKQKKATTEKTNIFDLSNNGNSVSTTLNRLLWREGISV